MTNPIQKKGERHIRLITVFDDPNLPFSGTTWAKYLAGEEKRMQAKRDNVKIATRERDGFVALARYA